MNLPSPLPNPNSAKKKLSGGWVVVVDQPIKDPISGPSLSFVFCLLALSLTKTNTLQCDNWIGIAMHWAKGLTLSEAMHQKFYFYVN